MTWQTNAHLIIIIITLIKIVPYKPHLSHSRQNKTIQEPKKMKAKIAVMAEMTQRSKVLVNPPPVHQCLGEPSTKVLPGEGSIEEEGEGCIVGTRRATKNRARLSRFEQTWLDGEIQDKGCDWTMLYKAVNKGNGLWLTKAWGTWAEEIITADLVQSSGGGPAGLWRGLVLDRASYTLGWLLTGQLGSTQTQNPSVYDHRPAAEPSDTHKRPLFTLVPLHQRSMQGERGREAEIEREDGDRNTDRDGWR